MPTVFSSAANAQSLKRALGELQILLGSRVTTSTTQREHHSHGESYHKAALPDMVCFPKTTREVSEIMLISARHRIPAISLRCGHLGGRSCQRHTRRSHDRPSRNE